MKEFEIEIEMWVEVEEQQGRDNGDLIISGVPGNPCNVEPTVRIKCASTRKTPNLAAIPGSSLR